MLLRSSSTPVLGSLLSSFSESPNRDFENSNSKHPPSSDHNLKKISFSHGGIPHFSSFACNSSPISHGESNAGGARGFRRAQSDGNLEGLAAASCDMDEFQISNPPTRSSRKPSISVLQTIPSFSIYNSREYEDENDPEEEQVKEEDLDEKDGSLARSVTIGDNIIAIGSGEFNFEKYKSMGSILEEEINSGVDEEREQASPPLYLARGIGIDGLGFGNAVFTTVDSGLDGSKAEEHYKRMVEENPSNPLFLRNFAQFLYQSKGDLRGAEEYYSRAILLDPGDGEILSQYAKLVWELHHDHERASSYFERAVQFAPEDSHVLAAYASFLWETEDEEEEDSQPLDLAGGPVNCSGVMASASA